jgi:ubiquitin carboxyl-terminal hydrolase 10
MHIEVLPPVLVLHLKQFLYDAAVDDIVKISKPVQFVPELEFPLGVIFFFVSICWPRLRTCRGTVGTEIMAAIVGKSAEPVHYKLCGVLYCHGNSESAGGQYYTVDVLHPNLNRVRDSGEAWLHIDGNAVSMVQHEEMFGWDENDQSEDPSKDQCVYMLFYCRTVSAQI